MPPQQPIPRPTWKKPEPPQPVWRRILLALMEVLTVFGGGRVVSGGKTPQFIRPLYYRIRLKEAEAAPTYTRPAEAPAPAPSIAMRSHTVRAGESLWKIAEAAYGRGERWIDVWHMNRDRIRDPDLIFTGQKLALPDREVHRPSGSRPGVTVQEIPQAPKQRIAESPPTPFATELQNRIRRQTAFLHATLGDLASTASQTFARQKEITGQLQRYTSEAREAWVRASSAASKTDLVAAAADLLDIARDLLLLTPPVPFVPRPSVVLLSRPAGRVVPAAPRQAPPARATPQYAARPPALAQAAPPTSVTPTPRRPSPFIPLAAEEPLETASPIAAQTGGGTTQTAPVATAPEISATRPQASSDTEAPSAPTGLNAIAISPRAINLSWEASGDNIGVRSYFVYRNGVRIATVTAGTSFSDEALAPSTTYFYAVEAYDAAGNLSAPSATVEATTPPAPETSPSIPVPSMIAVALESEVLAQSVGNAIAAAGVPAAGGGTSSLITVTSTVLTDVAAATGTSSPIPATAAQGAADAAAQALRNVQQVVLGRGDLSNAVTAAAQAVSAAVVAEAADPGSSAAVAAKNAADTAIGLLAAADRSAVLAEVGNLSATLMQEISAGGAGGLGGEAASGAGATASGGDISQGVLGAAGQAVLGTATLGVLGQSGLTTAQTVAALAIGALAMAFGIPAPVGLVAAAVMGAFNQAQTNQALNAIAQGLDVAFAAPMTAQQAALSQAMAQAGISMPGLMSAVQSGTMTLSQAQAVQGLANSGVISTNAANITAAMGAAALYGGLLGALGTGYSSSLAVAMGATNFGSVSPNLGLPGVYSGMGLDAPGPSGQGAPAGEGVGSGTSTGEGDAAGAVPSGVPAPATSAEGNEGASPSGGTGTGTGAPAGAGAPAGEGVGSGTSSGEGDAGGAGGAGAPGTGGTGPSGEGAPAGEGVGSGTSSGEGDAGGAGGGGVGGGGGGASGDGGSGPGSAGDGVGSIFIMKATSRATGIPLEQIAEPIKVMADALNQNLHPGASDLVVPEYRMRASILIETIARRPDWRKAYAWIAKRMQPALQRVAGGDMTGAAKAFRKGFEQAEEMFLGTGTGQPDAKAPRPADVGASTLMTQWAEAEVARQAKKFGGRAFRDTWRTARSSRGDHSIPRK
ncbi:MAG: LysM peptidoglycan-binding domain-containing protein [Candidatus Sungbacteria bacterium]|uniref:LysM peptidoglycan-binding domain-containing protein n=1 Tax=Candidatus Sungiibacteriota bacterium TaxID=2750080 RepID=A0A932YWS0_9BACT|nr:LysM peptidoglycan-binding domain-containing protein [Candidatus Sungbacteria bacterium]